MDRWNGKIAVVTGASAGIGAAIVTHLVKNGLTVVGLARRTDKVLELKSSLENAPGKLYAFATDITKEEDINNAFDWVKENLKTVHVLVNNAGGTVLGNLIDGKPEEWRNTINLNVLGLCICTKKALQLMRETGVDDGHVIHINSMLGHRVLSFGKPMMNVYPASKFAVTALTETLRQELRFLKTNIRVTSISPGYTKTTFASEYPSTEYEEVKAMLANIPGLAADDVAEAVVYVLSTPPHVQVHELMLTAV